jgi:hypothetical protein
MSSFAPMQVAPATWIAGSNPAVTAQDDLAGSNSYVGVLHRGHAAMKTPREQ